MQAVRAHLPIVYVEAVPVRLDGAGRLVSVGLLLAPTPDGSISRTLVTGRVLHGETIRAAVLRHIAKDLGPMAIPRLPVSPAPFTVAEYFPDPQITGFQRSTAARGVSCVRGTGRRRLPALAVGVGPDVALAGRGRVPGGRG